ncbi:MAG: deaminase [Patescibacteria group bacterium]
MEDVKYPYLPEGWEIKFVPESNEFMQEAKDARDRLAGDTLYPVGGVLIKDRKVIGKAGNGYNRGRDTIHICPRYVANVPSGERYDLCDLHEHPGHSERMVLKDAMEKGIDPSGSDIYLYGHWWCCEPCWNALIEAGVANVYLVEGAHEQFARDNVYSETLTPSVKSIYFSYGLTNLPDEERAYRAEFLELLAQTGEQLGLSTYLPHLHTDPIKNADLSAEEVFNHDVQTLKEHDVVVAEVTYPSLGTGGELMVALQEKKPIVLISKKGTHVSRFATGNPAVVYHIEYEDEQEVCDKLQRVLRQL